MENTKTDALPKSKAKTAYGLLNEVKALILAEPLRYRQSSWILKPEDGYPGIVFPACDTVACVAGWVTTLKPRRRKHGVGPDARKTLGITERQAEQLFDGYCLDQYVPEGEPLPFCQTPEYAALGVKHITAFQKKYAKQLKAKRV